MKAVSMGVILLVCAALSVGGPALVFGGEKRGAPIIEYEGKIKSIKIDKPGLRPGVGEATIVLTKKQGGDVTLLFRPGTWVKRGHEFLALEDLSVGDGVEVEGINIPGDTRIRVVEFELDEGDDKD